MKIPKIQEIPLAELVIDIALSGRSDKEIKSNAKSLAPLMKAHGAWDAHQPGEYFTRDGVKRLAAGFTRTEAAKALGIETGYFVEVPDDATKLRTACIRTNSGQPISTYEQGRIYAAMRDGSDPEKLAVGEVAFAPMKTTEIESEIGKSRQWIETCIAVFEEVPAIAELVQSGAISVAIAKRARELVKDDLKRVRFVQAAVRQAKASGDEIATMKHLDAVRPDYAPLKAAKSQPDAPAKKTPTPHNQSTIAETIADVMEETNEPEPELMPQREMQHGQEAKPNVTQRTMFAAAIEKWGEDCMIAFADGDVDQLVDALMEAKLPF